MLKTIWEAEFDVGDKIMNFEFKLRIFVDMDHFLLI